MSLSNDKYVFISFGVHCGYCQKMKRDIYSDSMVGEFVNKNFYSFIVDETSDLGKDLAERFNIYLYPSFLVLDCENNLVSFSAAYMKENVLLKFLESVIEGDHYKSPPLIRVNWNKLKTKNSNFFQLTNLASISWQFLNFQSLDEFLTTDVDSKKLIKSDALLKKSLDIEEYYFNTSVAAILHYKLGNLTLAKSYAKKALYNFPQHFDFLRLKSRKDMLEYINKNI